MIGLGVAYLSGGWVMLTNRPAADPARLTVWLSGTAVLYLLYHALKLAWSSRASADDDADDLRRGGPQALWIDGGPVTEEHVALDGLIDRAGAAVLKVTLIMVALYVDAAVPAAMAAGILLAMLTADAARPAVAAGLSASSPRHRRWAVAALTAVVAAAAIDVTVRVLGAATFGDPPLRWVLALFQAVGGLTASPAFRVLAAPLLPAASLATAAEFGWTAASDAMIAAGVLTMTVAATGPLRRAAGRRGVEGERRAAADIDAGRRPARPSIGFAAADDPTAPPGAVSAMVRRNATTARRHAATILTGLAVPTALCLSPLFTGHGGGPLTMVLGGVAVCTLLLTPATLRLDFRRDGSRLSLLRTLPLSPVQMVVAQLAIPALATWTFQAAVLVVTASVLPLAWPQWIFTAVSLAALAVAALAIENTAFLLFPHDIRRQGVDALIRTKLLFLAKTTFAAVAVAAMVAWAWIAHRVFPETLSAVAAWSGAGVIAVAAALAAVGSTTWSWRRFDLAEDRAAP